MKLKNIDHMVITTDHPEQCIHFYVDMLEMEHESVHGRHVLKFGNQKINIHMYAGEFKPCARNAEAGSQDFCLIADGNIYEIKEELEKKGCAIVEGVVERHGAVGVMDSVYVYDPDGNLVEISVYR